MLLESEHPLSPQEVHEQAMEEVPSLGLATVYRQLRQLEEEGAIHAVLLPGLPPRFERAEIPHHHHFHCERCDRVYDLEGCAGSLEQLLPKGFAAERHEITFFGLCPDCGKGRKRRTKR